MTSQTILTVEQVAETLHVSGRTVRNLLKRGRFPNAVKMDPLAEKSTWQIPQSDLDNYIKLSENSL